MTADCASAEIGWGDYDKTCRPGFICGLRSHRHAPVTVPDEYGDVSCLKKSVSFLQTKADWPKLWSLLPHEIGQPTRKNTHILMAAKPQQWPGHTADARQCGVWWVWNDTALDCARKLFYWGGTHVIGRPGWSRPTIRQ